MAVELLRAADRSPRQHRAEQHEYDDRPDVDQHLHPGDELRGQHEVAARERAEAHHQPERGMDDVARGHDQHGRTQADDAEQPEDGVGQRHAGCPSSGALAASPSAACAVRGGTLRATLPSARAPARVGPAPLTSLAGSALGTSAGGAGTVGIHSRSRSRSCFLSTMSPWEYSNSGDQNNASNGQTSMQMPQYMHNA